jgi:hypothetical protein
MASCRKCLQSLDEIQRILEESGSECDNVLSEDEISSRSERESGSENEDSATDNDERMPPASKRPKEEGWNWIETGDRPSKLHFTGNPGIKPAIIRNLPPEPNLWKCFNVWSTTHCGKK